MAKHEDATVAIVIAWVVDDFEVVREGWRSANYRPEIRTIRVARAAMWLNHGTAEDVDKARTYVRGPAAVEGSVVFTYPTTERDPLGAAKRDVLKASTA